MAVLVSAAPRIRISGSAPTTFSQPSYPIGVWLPSWGLWARVMYAPCFLLGPPLGVAHRGSSSVFTGPDHGEGPGGAPDSGSTGLSGLTGCPSSGRSSPDPPRAGGSGFFFFLFFRFFSSVLPPSCPASPGTSPNALTRMEA